MPALGRSPERAVGVRRRVRYDGVAPLADAGVAAIVVEPARDKKRERERLEVGAAALLLAVPVRLRGGGGGRARQSRTSRATVPRQPRRPARRAPAFRAPRALCGPVRTLCQHPGALPGARAHHRLDSDTRGNCLHTHPLHTHRQFDRSAALCSPLILSLEPPQETGEMAEFSLLWSNFQLKLGETTTVSNEISSGLGKISSTVGKISSKVSTISSKAGQISSELGQIFGRLGEIFSRAGEILSTSSKKNAA